jgi:tetratricopeptide (TPR) repeat protein
VKRIIAILVCAAVLAAALPCLAGNPKAESKQYFQKGIKLFNSGAIEEALVQFHKAYVAYPHWKIRKNIGLCYMQLGDNVLALQELYGYLEEGKNELAEKEKQAVMNVIFSVLEKVGIIRFTMIPPSAKVILDGQISSEAGFGKDIYVDPGLHVISVMNEQDQLLYREEMTIDAGEQKEIDVSKTTSDVDLNAEEVSQIPSWQEVGPPKEKKLKVLHPAIFGTSVALTVVMLGACIGTGAKALAINREFKDTFDQDEQDRLKEDGKKYETITNALIGVTAGLAAVSLVLFFFTDFKGSKKKKETPALTLVPLLTDQSLGLSTGFEF